MVWDGFMNIIYMDYNLSIKNLLKLYNDYDTIVEEVCYRYPFQKMYSHFSDDLFNTKISTFELISILHNIYSKIPDINIQIDGNYGAFLVKDNYKFLILINSINIISSEKYKIELIDNICKELWISYKLKFIYKINRKSQESYILNFNGPQIGCNIS